MIPRPLEDLGWWLVFLSLRVEEAVATFLRNRRIDGQLFWLDVRTEVTRLKETTTRED